MADHGDQDDVSGIGLNDQSYTASDYVTLARAIAFRELRRDRDVVPPMTDHDWDVIVSALCIATGYELNKMTRDIRARQRGRK